MGLSSICFFLVLAGSLLATQTAKKTGTASVPEYTYKIVKAYTHDPEAYTQGLVYEDGYLYEGTGLNGRPSLRKVRLETGKSSSGWICLQRFLEKALL